MDVSDCAVLTVAVSLRDESSKHMRNTHIRDPPIVNLQIYYPSIFFPDLKIEVTQPLLFLHYKSLLGLE